MEYGAIDLHSRNSQIRIVDAGGSVVCDKRVPTTRERLLAVFAGRPPVRILIESATESAWVAEALEAAGHAVVVVDPNYAPMYGELHRRVKTDRRDAAALAEANRRGWFRPAHRTSPAQRDTRQVLTARRQLVQMRTATVSVIRALLRQRGHRLASGSCPHVPAKIAALALPPAVAAAVLPLARTITLLSREIAGLDAQLEAVAAADSIVRGLRSVPGVGSIVALTFRALIDDVGRFQHAGQVSAALGLVPREHSSAERRQRGHITKVGSSDMRSLLVQAAWACWRSRGSGTLRAWVDRLAARRGRRIAVVALARRLSRILFAVWRDHSTFKPGVLAGA